MTSTSPPPADAPTDEAIWIHLVGHAPELALSTRPVVVIAPHPDDECLAVGGLLAELRGRDVDITVITVTDGDAARPDQAAVRAAEQALALDAIGVTTPPVRLGLPDGAVAHHLPELRQALRPHLKPDTVVLAPWEHDGHTDHDAVGAVARQLVTEIGATLLAYPVWAWQWAAPDDLAGLTLRRATLSEAARDAKGRALACFSSQLSHRSGPPIVAPEVLARFLRPWEVVIDLR